MKNENALVEVYEVLNNIPKVYYDKIPQEVLDSIYNNKNNDYVWKYDFSKTLLEQNLMNESYEMISYIFKNYLIDGEEKRKLQKEIYDNKYKINQLKKCNTKLYDKMFSNKNKKDSNDTDRGKPVPIKKNLIQLLLEKITRLLK